MRHNPEAKKNYDKGWDRLFNKNDSSTNKENKEVSHIIECLKKLKKDNNSEIAPHIDNLIEAMQEVIAHIRGETTLESRVIEVEKNS